MKRIFNSMFLMAGAVAVALNFASCKGDDGDKARFSTVELNLLRSNINLSL
ncbi:MAG: hypothetical protein IKZ99_06640 [Salinivirgaceae bacterium]|nr:hypothetical protein [Salinivirgaceae bacterium]